MNENSQKTELVVTNPITNQAYDEVLKIYVGKDELRSWICQPFFIEKLACSTNAHEMVFFSKDLVKTELNPCENENPQIILNNIPEERNQSFFLDIEKIEECLKNIDLVDVTKRIGEDVECSECNGDGEVEWEYGSWTKDMDCPKCDGDGYQSISKNVPTGEKQIDALKLIDIKNSRFSIVMLDRLLKVKNLLNEKDIALVYQLQSNKASVFKIGSVEVLCMPMMKTEDNDELVVLKLS